MYFMPDANYLMLNLTRFFKYNNLYKHKTSIMLYDWNNVS